jgi:hypothetical protein
MLDGLLMSYDLEKYRVKREKVLGVRKRGLSFGAAAALVAAIIVIGLGALALPRVVDYLANKNLDDAIYKLAGTGAWPAEVVQEIGALPGVRTVTADSHDTRLMVTFDRLETSTGKLDVFFARKGLQAELLNTMDHGHRMTILEKEAKLETP